MKSVPFCALVLAVAAAAPAAHADRTAAIGVRYNDLDLSRPRDAAVMLRRLDEAAMDACGATWCSLREYRMAIRESRCHTASLDRAVSELGAPMVRALYDREAGVMGD